MSDSEESDDFQNGQLYDDRVAKRLMEEEAASKAELQQVKPTAIKKKRMEPRVEPTISTPRHGGSRNDGEDRQSCFGKLVVLHLRSLSEYQQSVAEQNILKALFDAKYETPALPVHPLFRNVAVRAEQKDIILAPNTCQDE